MEYSRPFFVWFDSVRRFTADEAGIERLAAIITLVWHDAKADKPREQEGESATGGI